MKITFIGVPGEQHDTVYMYGQNFPLNEAVEVTNPIAMGKLSRHPHFKAEAEKTDSKTEAQIEGEFKAAANASLAEAEAAAQTPAPTPAPEAPPPAPPEPTRAPLASAQAYQDTYEKAPAAAGTVMPETVKSAQEYQDLEMKGGTYGNADAEPAGDPDPAQDRVPGSKGDGARGRSGKGR